MKLLKPLLGFEDEDFDSFSVQIGYGSNQGDNGTECGVSTLSVIYK